MHESRTHRAILRKVVEHDLDPGAVGIPLRRPGVFPTGVAFQLGADGFLVFGQSAVIRRAQVKIAPRIVELLLDLRLLLGEGVRDILEEDQAEHCMLVGGGGEVRPQPVGSGPESFVGLAEGCLGSAVGH